MDIKDVAAINTGGASGLGAGTAKRLAKAGAKVAIFDLNAELGIRANEIAIDYACGRQASGKVLIDHEGIGFMLTENLIDLRQSELMNDWCAGVLDAGEAGGASGAGGTESWMTNVAVSEALMRVADRCVQVMGGSGVTSNTIVEQVFREIRAFRIYDGPTEVHKWSLAKKIKRDWKAAQA